MRKEQIQILKIYHEEIPACLLPFLNCPEMRRIDHVGMHCALEYTSFPFYSSFQEYSRFTHSFGVACIIYHFTKDDKQALSGLFHDIATPCFAHVIDFLKGDHIKQEATEEKTEEIIENSSIIVSELKKLSLTPKDVSNYHLFPIADNDTPKLSADRLEYTLSNLWNYSFATLEEIQEMYEDLIVGQNEFGEEELMFTSLPLAIKFAHLTLKNSRIYVADEDRYGMEYLARILKRAMQRNIIEEKDLYQNEETLIEKLCSDEESKKNWKSFCSLKQVMKEETPSSSISFKIPAKKRFIDPYVKGQGRVSVLFKEIQEEIEEFKNLSFDYYLKAI